jgi:hypothetical protein
LLALAPEQKKVRVLFSELLKRYRDTESLKKKGVRNEQLRIDALLRRSIANKYAAQITAQDLETYAEDRLKAPG